jgi:hypothetical protein
MKINKNHAIIVLFKHFEPSIFKLLILVIGQNDDDIRSRFRGSQGPASLHQRHAGKDHQGKNATFHGGSIRDSQSSFAFTLRTSQDSFN